MKLLVETDNVGAASGVFTVGEGVLAGIGPNTYVEGELWNVRTRLGFGMLTFGLNFIDDTGANVFDSALTITASSNVAPNEVSNSQRCLLLTRTLTVNVTSGTASKTAEVWLFLQS
jgi:hypothetical protein